MIECLRPPLVELPNERVAAQFERYYSLLVEWNEKFNLTAITEKETVYRKHFADSLYGAEWMQGAVCDIGAGAGFPSLPLAIVGAADSFTLVDSVGKKVNFLSHVATELGLDGVKTLHARAEEVGKGPLRESFDTVTARAVAALPTLLEYLAPLAKIGGHVVVYKTDEQEIQQASKAAKLFGLELIQTQPYEIEGAKRCLFIYRKVVKTPTKYPRMGNKPRLEPIV